MKTAICYMAEAGHPRSAIFHTKCDISTVNAIVVYYDIF